MYRTPLRLATTLAALLAFHPAPAAPLPQAATLDGSVLRVSDSPDFDDACAAYYALGNDPEVSTEPGVPESFCGCLAGAYADQGLDADALDFFARTYSDDLTTFIDEYPLGEAWMEQSFRADGVCKAE